MRWRASACTTSDRTIEPRRGVSQRDRGGLTGRRSSFRRMAGSAVLASGICASSTRPIAVSRVRAAPRYPSAWSRHPLSPAGRQSVMPSMTSAGIVTSAAIHPICVLPHTVYVGLRDDQPGDGCPAGIRASSIASQSAPRELRLWAASGR